ncbi:MAG: AAA family ATPase [Thaumarchaeota archaeon]|nr:AAA family ATPase [Nitrososphaerota archaeon]
MISSLEILNFRGIRKLSLTELKRFNIFIDKNDARKSTILESIYVYKPLASNQVLEFRQVLRSTARTQLGRELWHNYNTKLDPTIKITNEGRECSLRFHIGFDVNTIDLTLVISGEGAGNLKLDGKLASSKNNTIQQLWTNVGGLKSSFGNMIFFNQSYRSNLQQLEREVSDKKLTPEDIYDTSTSFEWSEYAEGGIRLSLVSKDTDVYVDSFGEGHKSGISLLTILKGCKNSIILIEEIETHQHPSSLRDLISRLQKICIENNNQVFVTTHSPDVLQFFAKSQDTLFFHLQKNEEYGIISNQITPKDVNMIRDIGWDIGNLLKYEKFMIVEGLTDQTIIRHVFYKLKKYWPEEIGINILTVGGFKKQKELLKTISTDEKTIFIQRDFDSKTEADIRDEILKGFKELENEGYQKTEDDDKILLENKTGNRKLIKSNIFVTGLPQQFTGIKKHAIDDYLLAILQKEPTILSRINAQKTSVTLTGNNSKEILNDILGSYDIDSVMDIIKECDTVNVPQELKFIIDKIETS